MRSPDIANKPVKSNLIKAYVAPPCPHGQSMMSDIVRETGRQLVHATDAFQERLLEEPLHLDRLDFSETVAWNGLAGQLIKTYRRAHYELIHSKRGAEYRDALGALFDSYARSGRAATETEASSHRKKRYEEELHHLVNHGISEGAATAIATYGAIPRVSRLRRPELTTDEQVALAYGLLPGGRNFVRHTASTSKYGNDRLLRDLGHLSELGKITYPSLGFMAEEFDIETSPDRNPVLYAVNDHYLEADQNGVFRGCPALYFGSITVITGIIESTIAEHSLYERALGAKTSG